MHKYSTILNIENKVIYDVTSKCLVAILTNYIQNATVKTFLWLMTISG